MNFNFPNIKKTAAFFVITLAAAAAGCTGNQTANSPAANSNSNGTTASSNSNSAPQPDYSHITVTMPLIDAMLTDENFRNEARTNLQLSDEEIKKLVDASRDSVLSLTEDEVADSARSTRSAQEAAEKQVREVLGKEKGDRFLSFIRQHVAGTNSENLLTAKPNEIPADSRIVVNAPAYRMDVFENGQLKKSYKVGIGYPEFPLPVGLRKAKSIIFNPTWTPPDEPWVKGQFKPGKTVEAGSKQNPLGLIKIPIGLPSLIHGGKSQDRLGTFASHGCVGLTNDQVKDFALQLSVLGGSNISDSDVAEYGSDRKETKEIDLQNEVPVELRYETIVVEDGKLKIYRDVYERGTNTEENLRRVFEAYSVSFDDLQPADKEKILAGLEQMASDAKGEPVEEPATNSDKKPQGSSVTRNIKGEKELVFELAELSGKGYPAPVGIN